MSLALFDLDHTLLDGDSNTLWLDYLVDHGHLPADVRRQQADFASLYVAEKLDIADYLSFQLQLLTQRPLAEWLPVRAEFLAARIVPRVCRQAWDTLAAHRARGHRLLIITATHSFLSEAIGQLFGLPVIAPQAETRDGYLSGRIMGPICFREQKISCLAAWLANAGLSDELPGVCHFYSDSANDLPLLTAVSHPVAVNPDTRLDAFARQHGWRILSWRCA